MERGVAIHGLRRKNAVHVNRGRQHLAHRLSARIAYNNATMWTLQQRFLRACHHMRIRVAEEAHHRTVDILHVTPLRGE